MSGKVSKTPLGATPHDEIDLWAGPWVGGWVGGWVRGSERASASGSQSVSQSVALGHSTHSLTHSLTHPLSRWSLPNAKRDHTQKIKKLKIRKLLKLGNAARLICGYYSARVNIEKS